MRKSRLSEAKQQRLVELFIEGTTVREAADQVGVNRNTAAYYFYRLRQLICLTIEDESRVLDETDIDGTAFGASRKSKPDSGTHGYVAVFGILKSSKKVYTTVIPENRFTDLVQTMKQKVVPGSIVYTNSLDNYQDLNLGDFQHIRGDLSFMSADESHLARIEDFWEAAKCHLQRFYGIPREHLGLFLKEFEWRYNHAKQGTQLARMKKIFKDRLGLQSKKPVR